MMSSCGLRENFTGASNNRAKYREQSNRHMKLAVDMFEGSIPEKNMLVEILKNCLAD
jgi:hypothetical protein